MKFNRIEQTILKQIKKHGGASIFWITDNQSRACAVERLQSRGIIIRHRDDERDMYPWCVFSIADPPPEEGAKRREFLIFEESVGTWCLSGDIDNVLESVRATLELMDDGDAEEIKVQRHDMTLEEIAEAPEV